MRRKPRVGVTGGIASGKSLVAAALGVCGAAVAYADQVARGLMEERGDVRTALLALLGPRAYRADGSLDRPWLGEQLFADPELLEGVNAIVHPAVRRAADAWYGRAVLTDVPYTVYESALLFESGAAEDFDVVVHVYAPQALRLERAALRDGAESHAVLARMDAQWSDAERLAQEAYVLVNDGGALLLPQVFTLHRALVGAGR